MLQHFEYPNETLLACGIDSHKFHLLIGHLLVFSKFKINIEKIIDETEIFETLFIMSLNTWSDMLRILNLKDISDSSDYKRFVKKYDINNMKSDIQELSETILDSFKTFIPAKPIDDKQKIISSMPTGCGFPLETAEWLMSEYHMTFNQAMEMKISQIFGLLACCRQRNGGKHSGPDYYQRIYDKELRDFINNLKETSNGSL